MPLLDSVHEQATQILLNHAELPMIMCNTCPNLDYSITSFEFVYMEMKVEHYD